MGIGACWFLICIILPIIEAIIYGFGYTFFMWQFRNKDMFREYFFRTCYHWFMRPFRTAFSRLFGDDVYTQSITIRGKTFNPLFGKKD